MTKATTAILGQEVSFATAAHSDDREPGGQTSGPSCWPGERACVSGPWSAALSAMSGRSSTCRSSAAARCSAKPSTGSGLALPSTGRSSSRWSSTPRTPRRSSPRPPHPHILAQPADRGTAAAILAPTFEIARRDPEAMVAVFPSDHYIPSDDAFMAHVAEVGGLDRRAPGPHRAPRRSAHRARGRVRVDRARGEARRGDLWPYPGRPSVLGEAVACARREVPARRPSVEYLRRDRQGGRPPEARGAGAPPRSSPPSPKPRHLPGSAITDGRSSTHTSACRRPISPAPSSRRAQTRWPWLGCRGSPGPISAARVESWRSWTGSGFVPPGPTDSPPRSDEPARGSNRSVGRGNRRRRLKKVQMRGGARRPGARRSLSGSLPLASISGFARLAFGSGSPSVSARTRAPYLRRWAFFSLLRR